MPKLGIYAMKYLKKSENQTIIIFANIQGGIYFFETRFEFYESSEFYLPCLSLLFVFPTFSSLITPPPSYENLTLERKQLPLFFSEYLVTIFERSCQG